MYINKAKFVRERVSPLLVDAYPEVLGAAYEEKDKKETVDVYYCDGAVVKIDVTGDNLPALIQDVLDKIVFN